MPMNRVPRFLAGVGLAVLGLAAHAHAQEAPGVIGSMYPAQLVRGQGNVLHVALGRNNPVKALEFTPADGITVTRTDSRDLNQGSVWWEFAITVAPNAATGPRQLVIVQERGRTAPVTLTIPDHLPNVSNLRVTAAQVNRPTVDVQFNASNPGGTFSDAPYVWFLLSCGPQPEMGVVRGAINGTVIRASIPNPRTLQDKAAAPSTGNHCDLQLRATDDSNTDSNTASVTFDFM
jgi:hypothetical protein